MQTAVTTTYLSNYVPAYHLRGTYPITEAFSTIKCVLASNYIHIRNCAKLGSKPCSENNLPDLT